eukprot:11224631-Lingulodinium_polyedra.AAC.1
MPGAAPRRTPGGPARPRPSTGGSRPPAGRQPGATSRRPELVLPKGPVPWAGSGGAPVLG